MTERTLQKRELYYEGPNYAADAVIFDSSLSHCLLIKRGDTGEWALIGGFVDNEDSSSDEAARREALEEGGIEAGLTGGDLIYQGRTRDHRDSDTAWVETSAHLYYLDLDADIQAGDDAQDIAWHRLDQIPSLHGAHQMIIERGLDYIDGQNLIDAIDSADNFLSVDGGYMKYHKFIASTDEDLVFVKQQPVAGEVSPERFDSMLKYLKKEAGTMAHLRLHSFKHVSERSTFDRDKVVMDAYREEDGWHWEIDETVFDAYLNDALDAFRDLESMPVPFDEFGVEPSYQSLIDEGWCSLDTSRLSQAINSFAPQLDQSKQELASKLLDDVTDLQQVAASLDDPNEFVLCHHDMRQENLAWHPEKGVRIIDWSWTSPGLPGSDATNLLIDINKSNYDVSGYRHHLNYRHCLNLIGFWLAHSTLPNQGADGLRLEQFKSALSAYELLVGS